MILKGTYKCRYCKESMGEDEMKSRRQCQDCYKAKKAEWSRANPEKMRAARKQYEERHPRGKKRIPRTPPAARDATRARRRKVIEHYGAICVCCGETEYKFLCIDHIIPIKSVGHRGGATVYQAIRENYPDTFQILCHNCNMAKGFWGECPHKEGVSNVN